MILYTKNNCQACKFTKLHMANMGVTYEERNVDEDEAYMQDAIDTGFKSMPIVVLNGRVIASGFQPDKLNELEVRSRAGRGMTSKNEQKVLLTMRLNDLQRVYQMLLRENPILDINYITSEIEQAENALDRLDNYATEEEPTC